MSDLYSCIVTDIEGIFAANFSYGGVVVAWRDNDAEPRPDPGATPLYLRNEVHFGREKVIAFGGGLGANERLQFGSVSFICFSSRATGNENALLATLSQAMGAVRGKVVPGSYGTSTLSFIGDGSGFDVDAEENGNWFVRGCRFSFEYRFRG